MLPQATRMIRKSKVMHEQSLLNSLYNATYQGQNNNQQKVSEKSQFT